MFDENVKKYNEDDVSWLNWELSNEIDVHSIEGKQLDLCKDNIILSRVHCFCLQEEKREIKPEVFCVPNTSATASVKIS